MRLSLLAPRGAGCAALLALAAPLAWADATLPPMKPGFWQGTMLMHMNITGQPPDTDNTPMVTYNCEDAASMAAAMKAMAGAVPGCSFVLNGGNGTYTIDGTCKNIGGQPGTMTSTGTMVMEGQTAMHMTEQSSGTVGNMTMSSTMTGDSKWIGECPAGAKPGDFGTMQNGVFQKDGNALDMPAKPPGQ